MTRTTRSSTLESEAIRELIEAAVKAAVKDTTQLLCSQFQVLNDKVDKLTTEVLSLREENRLLKANIPESPTPQALSYASVTSAPPSVRNSPSPGTGVPPAVQMSVAGKDSSNSSEIRPADGNWVQVKKKKRTQGIVGSAQTTSKVFKSVKTGFPVRVFVSRLPPDIGYDELEREVLSKAGVAVKATKLQSKMPRLYASFLLDCISTDLKTLLHPSVWPEGLVVKRWFDHRKRIESRRSSLGASDASETAPAPPAAPSSPISSLRVPSLRVNGSLSESSNGERQEASSLNEISLDVSAGGRVEPPVNSDGVKLCESDGGSQ